MFQIIFLSAFQPIGVHNVSEGGVLHKIMVNAQFSQPNHEGNATLEVQVGFYFILTPE